MGLGGKIFGRLKVVGFSRKDTKYRKYWLCKCECGNEVITREESLVSGHTKSCGCLQKEIISHVNRGKVGDKHRNWKGGRITRCGYTMMLYKNHPRADLWGYVCEHVLIAEKILGEYIPRGHVIHHINGIKDDNRPENLMWFKSNSEHLKYHKLMEVK